MLRIQYIPIAFRKLNLWSSAISFLKFDTSLLVSNTVQYFSIKSLSLKILSIKNGSWFVISSSAMPFAM